MDLDDLRMSIEDGEDALASLNNAITVLGTGVDGQWLDILWSIKDVALELSGQLEVLKKHLASEERKEIAADNQAFEEAML